MSNNNVELAEKLNKWRKEVAEELRTLDKKSREFLEVGNIYSEIIKAQKIVHNSPYITVE